MVAAVEGFYRVFDKSLNSFSVVGVDHHLDVVVVGNGKAVVDRGRAWCPNPHAASARQAPALIISTSAAGREALPLPENAEIDRKRVERLDHPRHMPGGRAWQVVAKVPCDGPVPPPSIEVTPDISACSICLRTD